MIAEVVAHIWAAVQHLWHTEDGPFVLVVLPILAIYFALQALSET